jgi:hypothetical protein
VVGKKYYKHVLMHSYLEVLLVVYIMVKLFKEKVESMQQFSQQQ